MFMVDFFQDRPQEFWAAIVAWIVGGGFLLYSAISAGLTSLVSFFGAVVLGVWGVWLMREGLKEKKVSE